MTEQNKIIERLKVKFPLGNPTPLDIADFILADRKHVLSPLISLGDMSLGSLTQLKTAIRKTIKQAGVK